MQGITAGEYSLVYNSFSFAIAAMGAATIFLWLGRSQVSFNYKTTLTISGLVTAIATYHYFRIFNSWTDAYTLVNDVVTPTGVAFNSAYRYVDWLLTVPLLLIELIFVMRLPEDETAARATRPGLAAAVMVILGYPARLRATTPRGRSGARCRPSRSSTSSGRCSRGWASRSAVSRRMCAGW